ncbi:mycofactocin-coupled SDR family oxidoreductase [Rhodococcus koreensis]
MAGRLEGKVAFITGAARGQGRSHALTLAREGADIIAVDLCSQPDWMNYPLATLEDLDDTTKLIKGLGRQVVSAVADVRDRTTLTEVVAGGVARLGRLDIVVANAGVCPLGDDEPDSTWFETVSTNLTGVLNTVEAGLPHLRAGGSIIATGSFAGMRPQGVRNGPGGSGYSYAKRGVAQMVHSLAMTLGERLIRVNAIHPGNCNTDMLNSPPMFQAFRPDLETPSREDSLESFASTQIMPIPYVEPSDISNAVLFLASDESRYITGTQLSVDGGALLKAGVSGL